MGYTKGDTIPPSADVTKVSSRSQLASAGPFAFVKKGFQAAGVAAGIYGATFGLSNSLASSAIDPDPTVAGGQISNVVKSEQTRERQRRSGHMDDATRDQGSRRRWWGGKR